MHTIPGQRGIYCTRAVRLAGSPGYILACVNVALDVTYNETTESLGGNMSMAYNQTMYDLALDAEFNTNITALGGYMSDAYITQIIDAGLQLQFESSIEELGGIDSAAYRLKLGEIYAGSDTCGPCDPAYLQDPLVFLHQFVSDGCPDPDTSEELCPHYSAEVNGQTSEECVELLTGVYEGANLVKTTIVPIAEATASDADAFVSIVESTLVASAEASNATVDVQWLTALNLTAPVGSEEYTQAVVKRALANNFDCFQHSPWDKITPAAFNTTAKYTTAVRHVGVQLFADAHVSSLAKALAVSAEAAEMFHMRLYWASVARDTNTTGGCGVPSANFTDKAGFYAQYVAEACPVVDTDQGTCSLDCTACRWNNTAGITPYAARESFRNKTNEELREIVLDNECFMWDNGLALPEVPKNLVLGRDGSQDGRIEAFEFVMYTETKESLPGEMAQRPFDPHVITEETATKILDKWYDVYATEIPGTFDTNDGNLMDVGPLGNGKGLGYRVNTFDSKSLDRIIENASSGAALLISVGLLGVFLYAFVTTRFSLLALGGVSLVVLGTVGGLGLSMWMGIKMNTTSINVLPFLMLGLGVDDMFLILRTLIRESSEAQLKDKHVVNSASRARWSEEMVGMVMVECGPIVALTTITNFAAFMIGTLTPLPVVQDFAVMAAVTVLVMFFVTVIAFPALCVISIRYTPTLDAARGCYTCMSSVFFCCTKQRQFRLVYTRDIVNEGMVHKSSEDSFVKAKLVPFLTHKISRIVIVVVFAVLAIVSAIGIQKIELGLSLKELAEPGTQEHGFIAVRDKYFGFYGSSMVTWDQNNFYDVNIQKAFMMAFNETLNIKYNSRQGESWVEEFLLWCSPSCEVGTLTPECGNTQIPACELNPLLQDQYMPDGYFDAGVEEFNRCTNRWYKVNLVTSQPSFFPLTNEGEGTSPEIAHPIQRSQVSYFSQELWVTGDYVSLIDQVRALYDKVADETGLRLYPSGPVFLFWEQYRNLWKYLLFNLGVALVCTNIIGTVSIFISMASVAPAGALSTWKGFCIILLKAFQGASVMTLVIGSIMAGVLAFMGYAGIDMSAIPALTIIACMGISIDLTALVTIVFCSGKGTHQQRIEHALTCVFVPTLDSMASTIVGCFALAFSVIKLFVMYFFAMYCAVAVYGALNGLVLLPTLLALIGPSAVSEELPDKPGTKEEDEKEEDAVARAMLATAGTGSPPQAGGEAKIKETKEGTPSKHSAKQLMKCAMKDFKNECVIGVGAFGMVRLVKHTKTGLPYALKMGAKKEMRLETKVGGLASVSSLPFPTFWGVGGSCVFLFLPQKRTNIRQTQRL